jgi:hypothetical protein
MASSSGSGIIFSGCPNTILVLLFVVVNNGGPP